MRCHHCGRELPDNAAPCTACGFASPGADTVVPQTPDPIPPLASSPGGVRVELPPGEETVPTPPPIDSSSREPVNPSGEIFYNRWGMPVSRPQSLHGIEFTAISSRRLAELSIATLGIYLFYWFYRNWQAVKKADKSRISPFWRALLAPFYSCSLFKRILESAQKNRL